MDPQLTYTLPKYQIASGAADIVMHTMERYFAHATGTYLTDAIAEGLMRTVRHAAKAALENPEDYDARATLMWAGSLSHNGLTGCGRIPDWGCHKLQAEVGGLFDCTHGAGLCALWASWARYCLDADPGRFAQYATNVFDVPGDFDDVEGTALAGIAAWEEWCHQIGMPTSLRELGIEPTQEQVDEMAQRCAASNGTDVIGNFKALRKEDCAKIYEMAR
jgi:alcohol dehydrogenase YqhD (iron-dependent ADH family)